MKAPNCCARVDWWKVWAFIKRWAWLVVVCCIIIFGFWLATTEVFQSILVWIEGLDTFTGIVAFISIQTAITVLFLPGALFVLFAGFVHGPFLGTLLAWTGSALGAVIAFLLGRLVIAERVRKWAAESPFFTAVLRAIDNSDEGWKIILLLRLSPLMPFALINYLLSSTGVSLWTYTWASSLGVLPPTAMYVYVGSTAKTLSSFLSKIINDEDETAPTVLAPSANVTAPGVPIDVPAPGTDSLSTTQYWVMGIGIIVTIAVAVLVTLFTSRAIKRASRLSQFDTGALTDDEYPMDDLDSSTNNDLVSPDESMTLDEEHANLRDYVEQDDTTVIDLENALDANSTSTNSSPSSSYYIDGDSPTSSRISVADSPSL